MTRKRRRPSQPVSQPAWATNPVIAFLHSSAMMGDERWEEVISALHRFLELDDIPLNRQMAYQNLSVCYLALERFDEALAALDEAQRMQQPVDPDIIYSRGVTCACSSRFPEAIAAFEQYARNWPKPARQRDVKQTLRTLRDIEHGKIPTGSYLLEHLQDQIVHNLEVDDFHLVESKARRMISAVPERSEGHFAQGLAYTWKRISTLRHWKHSRPPKSEIPTTSRHFTKLGTPILSWNSQNWPSPGWNVPCAVNPKVWQRCTNWA